MQDQLDIADFLIIAEHILGIDAKEAARITRIPEAESALAAPFASYGTIVFYDDPIERAAICCSRIVRNHPLVDGNKRVAYECMIEMLYRSGVPWKQPQPNPDADAMLVEYLASREISEAAFIKWVELRVQTQE